MRPLVVIALLCGTARADRHVVQRGETLEYVAKIYGCTTGAVLRANRLDTTLVPPGTVVDVPVCARPKRSAPAKPVPPKDDDERAREALAVIDGAAIVKTSRSEASTPEPQSVGEPWHGTLRGAKALPRGDGYQIRHAERAFGASHVVAHLQQAIAEVRALYPEVHPLAIGDISAAHGGKLDNHQSHQSGLDVDVGFYFTQVPAGYPDGFVAANRDLDLEATWALIVAFAHTADLPTGVEMIFLDRDIQARLYRWAKQHGTPDEDLGFLLQYPRDTDELVGLVRHWPNHTDHLHVRFKRPPA